MEGFSDGSSTLPASTKKKDMTAGHVFLFDFRSCWSFHSSAMFLLDTSPLLTRLVQSERALAYPLSRIVPSASFIACLSVYWV